MYNSREHNILANELMAFERVISDQKGIRLVQEFSSISAIFYYSRGKLVGVYNIQWNNIIYN